MPRKPASALAELAIECRRLSLQYPSLRYAQIPLDDNSRLPELAASGDHSRAPTSAAQSIAEARFPNQDIVFPCNAQLDFRGGSMLHLVFGIAKHAEGWDLFCELASQICCEHWPENVLGVALVLPTKLCPAIEWLAIIRLLASETDSIPLNRATWIQWIDGNRKLRSHCLPTDGPAIDNALKGLGITGDVRYRVPYWELEYGIFRASSEAIGLLLTELGSDEAPSLGDASTFSKIRGEHDQSERPQWDEQTERRNRWIYERALALVPHKKVLSELKSLVKENNWEPITSIPGLRSAAKAYSARHPEQPQLPKRQAGRKSKR
jgi:hypothetical protein